MTADELFAAFQLPAKAQVNRWIPKTALNEYVTGAADRKLIDSVIERLDWIATLSPKTIGIPVGGAALEVQLMALTARKEPNKRLLTVIHRAVPHPVMLVSVWDGGMGFRLSIMAVHEGGVLPLVLDCDPSVSATQDFVGSLALPNLPQTGPAALYTGLIERAEALEAARISGGSFRLPKSAVEAEARRNSIALYFGTEVVWKSARNAAKSEKRLARKVELANQANEIKRRLDELARLLGE